MCENWMSSRSVTGKLTKLGLMRACGTVFEVLD
jgi:hypothetical protein